MAEMIALGLFTYFAVFFAIIGILYDMRRNSKKNGKKED